MMMTTASMSAEDYGLGPYHAKVVGWDDVMDEASRFEHVVDLRGVETLLTHLTNAARSLRQRMIVDAVCGPCEQCNNTRMIYPLRHGRPFAEHCPVCHPKIMAARATGLDAA